ALGAGAAVRLAGRAALAELARAVAAHRRAHAAVEHAGGAVLAVGGPALAVAALGWRRLGDARLGRDAEAEDHEPDGSDHGDAESRQAGAPSPAGFALLHDDLICATTSASGCAASPSPPEVLSGETAAHANY